MWVTLDGWLNVLDLQSPAQHMTPEFRSSLDRILDTDHSRVRELLEATKCRVLHQDYSSVARTAEFAELPLPDRYLAGDFHSVADLGKLLDAVGLRWALDALVAVIAYVDRG